MLRAQLRQPRQAIHCLGLRLFDHHLSFEQLDRLTRECIHRGCVWIPFHEKHLLASIGLWPIGRCGRWYVIRVHGFCGQDNLGKTK